MGRLRTLNANFAFRIWLLAGAAILGLVVAANMILSQSEILRNTLDGVFGSERLILVSGEPDKYRYFQTGYADKQAVLASANELNGQIAAEGMTLLKNDDSLPLALNSRITVFGKNSVDPVYGGTGSSVTRTSDNVTVYDSLADAGFYVNPKMKAFYEGAQSGTGRGDPPSVGDISAGIAVGETPVANYTSEVLSSCDDYDAAAVVVLSRIGGEGFDLPRTMKTSYADGAATIAGANADDHYLRLDNNEKDLISMVCGRFDNVVVVLNSAAPLELGELNDNTAVKGILWIGLPGGSGMNALGRVLNGEVNPSGRTVDTYARDFTKDPTWENFGNNNETDGNRYYVGGKKRANYFVEYEEGIYVGYRYYETRGETDGEKWYNENVVYPLGHGLSYTTFAWRITNTAELQAVTVSEKMTLTVKVEVTNTGARAGKDVVQLYAAAPYKGGIEKSSVVLVGFEKTPMLYPEADADETHPNSAVVEISVPAYYLASYDYNDANVNGFKGYEIEAGEYGLRVSRNAHKAVETVTLDIDAMTMRKDTKTTEDVVNRFDDVSGYIKKYMSRSGWEKTWPTKPTEADRNVEQSFIDSLAYDGDDTGKKWATDNTPDQSKHVMSYNDTKVKLYDLIEYTDGVVTVDYEDPRWKELLDQLTVGQMVQMIGTGNYNTMYIANIAKPMTTDPDGPVGFTAYMGDPSVYDTCFYASGCVLGATYNKELAYRMGEMVGNEGIIGNEKGDGRPYSGWYAPAVNIHRSPFSGRNWEYYSEDGYLSGIMATGVIRGAKSKGVYTYVKHFALNDQETNRSNNGILVWANEQSMREVYLRAFELTVKEGETTAMMSSFNRIGRTWAGGSYELLTEVLRNEWGFRGMVVTDYNYSTPYMNVDQMIRAGGDLNLSQANYPSDKMTATQVTALRRATKNVLYTVAGSNAMNGMGNGVEYRYALPYWQIWLIVLDALIAAGLCIWGYIVIRRALRADKNIK